jgi:hypothetical protein
MATPFGELITDAQYGPVLRRIRGGWEGTRNWRVNTHEESAAIVAQGVPLYGAAWDPSRPRLRIVELEARYMHGTNSGETGTGGWSRVFARYEETSTGIFAPQPGDAYTEPASTSTSTNVRYGLDADGSGDGALNEPIANGRGASKDVGGILLDVHVFLSGDDNGVLARVWDLIKGKVFNTSAMSLPAMLGASSNQRINVPARTGQYFDFRREVVEGVISYVHTVRIAPQGDLAVWRKEAERGHCVGPVQTARIYDNDNFDDLWPGA